MSGDLQLKMEHVLIVLAQVFPDIGYCQGMSFLAGEILHEVEHEELSFWLFAGLIEKHNLQALFKNGLPAVHLHMSVLGKLLHINLPRLDSHLSRLGVSWDMLTSKMVMTLCSAYFPLECLSYVYDIFFMDGWTGLYKIIIAYLGSVESELCARDLCALTEFLRKYRKCMGTKDVKNILRKASLIKISRDLTENCLSQHFRNEAERALESTGPQIGSVQMLSLQPYSREYCELKKLYEEDLKALRDKSQAIGTKFNKAKTMHENTLKKYQIINVEQAGLTEQIEALESTHSSIKKFSTPRNIRVYETKLPFRKVESNHKIKIPRRSKFEKATSDSSSPHDSDSSKDDLEVVANKLDNQRRKVCKIDTEVRKAEQELLEAAQEREDQQFRLQFIENQIHEMSVEFARKKFTLLREAAEILRAQDGLSISMFYFP